VHTFSKDKSLRFSLFQIRSKDFD